MRPSTASVWWALSIGLALLGAWGSFAAVMWPWLLRPQFEALEAQHQEAYYWSVILPAPWWMTLGNVAFYLSWAAPGAAWMGWRREKSRRRRAILGVFFALLFLPTLGVGIIMLTSLLAG